MNESPKRLMVLVSERPSEWIAKGEVIDRYYNPGDLFERVDLVITNDDRPDREAVQRMAGSARLGIHNVPTGAGFLTRTLGWQPLLVRPWARRVVELARELRPQLIRCYGAQLNSVAAAETKRTLGIPYAVSLHINPEENLRSKGDPIRERLRSRAIRRVEARGLRDADLVLPVYEAIVPFIESLGVSRYEVAYNMLNQAGFERKRSYALGEPIRAISVGRHIPEKRPANLIRALARLPGVTLTCVGDGPDHDTLVRVAAEAGVEDRVTFERSVPNVELCAALPGYDVFATHSEYWELSKAVLEAMSSGLPVLLNRRRGAPVPELTPEISLLTEDTAEGYRAALEQLIDDESLRRSLGEAAADRAEAEWSPEATEAHFVEIHRRLSLP